MYGDSGLPPSAASLHAQFMQMFSIDCNGCWNYVMANVDQNRSSQDAKRCRTLQIGNHINLIGHNEVPFQAGVQRIIMQQDVISAAYWDSRM